MPSICLRYRKLFVKIVEVDLHILNSTACYLLGWMMYEHIIAPIDTSTR